jgi:hypothetical protein
MIDMAQYEINSAYNKFLNQLVLWSYLYKRVEAGREQGFSPVKDYEKMISFQERVQNCCLIWRSWTGLRFDLIPHCLMTWL